MTQMSSSFARLSASLLLRLCIILSMLIGVILVLSATGWISGPGVVFPNRTANLFVGIVLIVTGIVVWVISAWLRKKTINLEIVMRVGTMLQAWNSADDALSSWQRIVNLVLVSILGLLFELALIRWLGTEIKVFAYLKNVVLIAAFLGLGLGFFTARRITNTFPLFLPLVTALASIVALGAALGLWAKIVVPSGEQLVLLGVSFGSMQAAPLLIRLISWIPFYVVTLFFFVFIAILFFPLGQYTGKCMRCFAPIPGYSMNLMGSLAGTLLFTLLAYAWLPPLIWFGLAALITVVVLGNKVPVVAWGNWCMAIAAILIFVVTPTQPGDQLIWSPYNQIVVSPMSLKDNQGYNYPWGYQLSVGEYYYYQDLIDLSPAFFQGHPDLPKYFQYSEYEIPYQLSHPAEVLILGAGGGNDVAAALRHGVRSVDAVDIDPAILQAGQKFHPEHPYDSSVVHQVADDARSFVKMSEKSYDLVLFGLLDSFQVLSAFGAVRLDNFVYTVEGMRDAYALVKPDGMLAVTFELYEPWMGQRISGILETSTGQKPTVIQAHHGTVFLVRKGTPISGAEIEDALKRLDNQASVLTLKTEGISLTTDDWPFLYLRERTMPFAYLTMLPILGLVALGLVRRIGASEMRIQWHFFFLGAGFLLMEVRVIGQVALLFGSTWIVNVVAISVILFMAILANGLVAVRRFQDVRPWGTCLLLALVISLTVPPRSFLGFGLGVGGTLAALVLALPVFFASIIFSISFRKTAAVDWALASNLAGAILGGMIEYVSLVLGMGSLGWIAAILYILALTSTRRR